jgi:putative ABC transport system permease protein
MSRTFQQIGAITLLNLRNIPARWSSSLVAVVGVAGVVLVLVAVLSIAEGFRATLDLAGSDDVAIVLRSGSDSEMSSGISQENVPVIGDASGVVRKGNDAIASPELYVVVDVPLRKTASPANAPFRGVGPLATATRKSFKLIKGRMFTTGTNEIIVGTGVAQQFSGLDIGQSVRWGPTSWTVVGEFADGGSVSESEIWGDARVVQSAYNRGNSYQSVRVKLQNAGAFKGFKDALTSDPRLTVSAQPEKEFYAEQSKIMRTIISNAGWTLAIMMGVGAIFAALNTMYNAVAGRVREIATLRAMGFGALPVVVSVLVESLVLGAVGGLLGGVLAYIFFDGLRSSTLNFQNFSQITFAFTITPQLIVTGIIYGLILTLIGGLLPGIRAARLPVTEGLRQL